MNQPKPDWYEQAKGGPFAKPLFTEEMKQEVNRQVMEERPRKRNFAMWTAALTIGVCLTGLLLFIYPNINSPAPAPASPEPSLNLESPSPVPPESTQTPETQVPELDEQIRLVYENPLDFPGAYPVDLRRVEATRIPKASVIVKRTIEAEGDLGNYFIYVKNEGDSQLYSGMEILTGGVGTLPTSDIYELGPAGELPYLDDIEVRGSYIFGEFYIRIYGVCGANCVTNDWIHFEEGLPGVPIRDFQLNTHIQEVDIDEDGISEVIATISSTIGEVGIFKKINGQIRFVDLNKAFQAEHPYSVIYDHNRKIFSAIFPNLKRMYQYKKGEDVMELIQNAEGGKDPLIIGGLYDGTDSIQLQVGKASLEANWFKVPYKDFGLYLPSSIKEVKFEDGSEYEAENGMGIIQFRDADESTLPYLRKESDLAQYSEYVGTEFWGDDKSIRYDYFLYEHDEERRTYIAIRYKTKDTEQIRPLFLSVVANIRYAPDN
ncbi:hypothetical protein [Cohnella sp.]|uniref:hypothetical protein n=1 Tax=Cohnella sp. TaxID=1883426 RepID=UPI003563FCD6